MKKLLLMLFILVYGIASAQTDNTRAKSTVTQTGNQSGRAKAKDTRTTAQQKKAAEKNIDALKATDLPVAPASAPGNVNTNSSAMPQVTYPVTTPPPGAPLQPTPVGTPDRKPSKE